MLLQLWSNWTKIFLGWKFLKDCCSLWIFKAIYVSVMEMSHVPLMYFLVYVLCSNVQKQDSFLTEMFTVWVSAEDWEMLEMSAVVSAACPDLSWARHWGNPDNAWPRIWLLNPWHLLVTSYNYSGSYNAPGPLIIPPGVIQTPSSLQSYSITPYKHRTQDTPTRSPPSILCTSLNTIHTPMSWPLIGCCLSYCPLIGYWLVFLHPIHHIVCLHSPPVTVSPQS